MGWLLARLRAGPSAGYRKRELGQSGSSRPAPLWSSLTARGSRSLAEPYVGRVWPSEAGEAGEAREAGDLQIVISREAGEASEAGEAGEAREFELEVGRSRGGGDCPERKL